MSLFIFFFFPFILAHIEKVNIGKRKESNFTISIYFIIFFKLCFVLFFLFIIYKLHLFFLFFLREKREGRSITTNLDNNFLVNFQDLKGRTYGAFGFPILRQFGFDEGGLLDVNVTITVCIFFLLHLHTRIEKFCIQC